MDVTSVFEWTDSDEANYGHQFILSYANFLIVGPDTGDIENVQDFAFLLSDLPDPRENF